MPTATTDSDKLAELFVGELYRDEAALREGRIQGARDAEN